MKILFESDILDGFAISNFCIAYFLYTLLVQRIHMVKLCWWRNDITYIDQNINFRYIKKVYDHDSKYCFDIVLIRCLVPLTGLFDNAFIFHAPIITFYGRLTSRRSSSDNHIL